MSEDLNRIRVGRRGVVALVDENGQYLTHPVPDRILTPARDDPALAEGRAGRVAATETISERGARIFVAAVPVESLGWLVHVELPAEEVYEPLQALL